MFPTTSTSFPERRKDRRARSLFRVPGASGKASLRVGAFLSAALALACPLSAQKGSYRTFGSGCPGTGPGACASNNCQGGTVMPFFQIQLTKYALRVPPVSTPLITGFELLTRSASRRTITITTEIYLVDTTSTKGAPAKTPIATGMMQVSGNVAWYRTTFKNNVVLKPNQAFFISWVETNSARIAAPRVRFGTKSTNFELKPNATAWTGPKSANWAWKVHCRNEKGVPRLSSLGVPRVNRSFNVELCFAMPGAVAVFATGASNKSWGPIPLPLDLTRFNAAGCSLLTSLDFLVGTQVDKFGNKTFAFTLPNITALIGGQFHNQWLVIDPKANGLGLAFSNAATGTIGR